MGRKRTPGLFNRGGVWHIDKQVHGVRLRESTGSSELEEAERYLAKRIEDVRKVQIYGDRKPRTFEEAAAKFVLENQHKASIDDDIAHLKVLVKFIGELKLEQVHIGTLQQFIAARKNQGVKNKTINLALGVVRRILNLAASEWLDEFGRTWLQSAPKIKLFPLNDARRPYPLSFEEQKVLFSFLPDHLRDMATFKVNTGCRENEVCSLMWDWELKVPELNTSVFIIPDHLVKNRADRLVILNIEAMQIIEKWRGKDQNFVFTYNGKPLSRMNNSAWRRAREKADLLDVRIHDLKHTFGRRLRSVNVSFEDRQDLLGHKSARITTHYSAAELHNLISAANKVVELKGSVRTITFLNSRNLKTVPHKIPTVTPTLAKDAQG